MIPVTATLIANTDNATIARRPYYQYVNSGRQFALRFTLKNDHHTAVPQLIVYEGRMP
jgi:hypothetical protein